jgi:WD40 repeat protein
MTLRQCTPLVCIVVLAIMVEGCGGDAENPPAKHGLEPQPVANVRPKLMRQSAPKVVVGPGDLNPDVNGDGVVTIADLVAISGAFGQPGGQPSMDINGDGAVDIVDLVTVAIAFGEDVVKAPAGFGDLLRTMNRFGSRSSIAFSHDGALLAFGALGTSNYEVRLLDVKAGQYLLPVEGFVGRTFAVAFSPDGGTLARAGEEWPVDLWDIASGQHIGRLEGHRDHGYSVAFSPDGTMVASGSRDARTRLWDVDTRTQIAAYFHTTGVLSVVFSPDSRTLVSSSREIVLWDTVAHRKIGQLSDGLEGTIASVAYSPDGRQLAGSAYGAVTVWEAGALDRFTTFNVNTRGVRSIAFSPDGDMIAAGDLDRDVTLWDVNARALIKTLRGHSDSVTSVAFSPDGSILASASAYEVKLWSVAR